MAKVVRFHEMGGPEVLKIEDLDVPLPGAGEVQLSVKAIGLNRAEAMFRSGRYLEQPQLPARLGYEAAGVIVAVGPEVAGLAVVDPVSIIPSFSLNSYGTYAEVVNAPAHAVIKHPPSISFETAAAAWMQYLTAYGALIDIAKLMKDEVVLIPAASSSVGLAAIEIANAVGAISVALTRGRSKREKLLAAGATHVVVTDEVDVIQEVRKLTGPQGARVIFDPVAGPSIETLMQITSKQGIYILYGALSEDHTPLPLFDVLSKWVTIRGYVMMEITSDADRLEKAVTFVSEGLRKGLLRPLIARRFSLDEIVESHRYLESNQQVGKVIINV